MRRGRSSARVAAALTAGLLAAGCTTPHRPFRTTTVPVDADADADADAAALRDPARRAAVAASSIERYDGFTVAIVEFDDQGRFWDRHQADALEGEVLRQAGGADDPGVLMSVFVHGWRHDADVCDANLACFRTLARRIALDQRMAAAASGGGKARPVVAVFVGWRGLSKKVWPLEQLSFVSRKNAALRVGSGDMTELLTRLDRMRTELNAAKKDVSRLVVLGHSLGGTVVYEALANVFKNRLAEVWPGVDVDGSSRVIRGFGDLVVLVNPAFEAERWRSIRELSSTYAGFSKRQKPVLVVVGSETDSATATFFPFGQWVATLFEKTRDPGQREALHTAIGNYMPYVTHHLERADLPPGAKEPHAPGPVVSGCTCELPRASLPMDDMRAMLVTAPWPTAAEGTDEGWGATPCRAERVLGPLRLTCASPGRRGNPFWVVRASPNVLHEHGGFFSPYFVEFTRRLLFEATAGPGTPEEPVMPAKPAP